MAQERKEDWDYQFSASVLEIYNERIFDLLAGGRDQDGDKLDVKQVCVCACVCGGVLGAWCVGIAVLSGRSDGQVWDGVLVGGGC